MTPIDLTDSSLKYNVCFAFNGLKVGCRLQVEYMVGETGQILASYMARPFADKYYSELQNQQSS
jgi:hypothetical protein